MNLTEKQKGIGLMFLSAALFSAMQAIVSLSASRIGTMQQVFSRNMISLFVAYILIRKNKLSVFGEKKHQPMLFARSILGFLGVWLLFYAARGGEQADIALFSRLSPFLITLLSVFFLGEKISKMHIPALVLAFVGAYITATPSFASNFMPILAAFASAVTSAGAYTLLAYFKGKVDALTVIMHFSTFSMVAAAPFMLADFVVPGPWEIVMLVLIGLFGSFGQITMTYAYRMAPAGEVSIYSQSGIVFSIIMGFLILGEVPKGTSLIGSVLVLGASALVYWYNNYYLAAKAEENTPEKAE